MVGTPFTTYVSAFLNLQEDRSILRSPVEYFKLFESLAKSTLFFHLFLSSCYKELAEEMFGSYPNLHIQYLDLKELELYKALEGVEYSLPSNRSVRKDTKPFMLLMNSKFEFLERAIHTNHFSTRQYAWIDFGLCYILKDIPKSLRILEEQSCTSWKRGLYIPGCWGADVKEIGTFFTSVNWRFCGGFFLGDSQSLLHLINLSKQIPILVQKYKILSWEVNLLAFLERYKGWKPIWYFADHNDSMLQIPSHYKELSG